MKALQFKTVGIIAKKKSELTPPVIHRLCAILDSLGCTVLLETSACNLAGLNNNCLLTETVYEQADVIVCVGGDGTLLSLANDLAWNPKPIIGVNLGRLGFLVDVTIDNLEQDICAIMHGEYTQDYRTLLHVQVINNDSVVFTSLALNDCILQKSEVSRMIDFRCDIDGRFVSEQRSDGLIIATPTGSTAYSLSAGGSIVMPDTTVFILVSVSPHTMSHRPIVVNDNSVIEITGLSNRNSNKALLSCDASNQYRLKKNDRIVIKKHTKQATILHPIKHDHFELLRKKLRWSATL